MKILLVDPEPDRAAALAEALEASGAAVTLATSGSFALTLLERNPHDVIVSRARLGDMEGHELCTILRDDPGMKGMRFALVARAEEMPPSDGMAGIDVILPATMSPSTMMVRISRLAPDALPEPEQAPPVEAPPAAEPAVAAGDAEESPPGFEGSVNGFELGALTREIADAGRTGHLLLSIGGAAGVVAFESGHVVHAELDDETGTPAFVALLAAGRRQPVAEFCFVDDATGGLRGTPRTVHRSIDELLEEN